MYPTNIAIHNAFGNITATLRYLRGEFERADHLDADERSWRIAAADRALDDLATLKAAIKRTPAPASAPSDWTPTPLAALVHDAPPIAGALPANRSSRPRPKNMRRGSTPSPPATACSTIASRRSTTNRRIGVIRVTTQPPPPALVGGPYKPLENATIGTVLRCEVLGDLIVSGFTDSPIPWPVGRAAGGRGRSSLVVRDDLARAVETESVAAVRHHFGASPSVVRRWRRALGVGRITPGTKALRVKHVPTPPTSDEARERGRKGARKRWGGSEG